jgi:SSS family solute:Na+ symporter
VLGLFTRWFHRWGLLAGWAAGIIAGLWMLYVTPNPATAHKHFGGSLYALSHLGFNTTKTIYPGLVAVIVNIVVAALVSAVLHAGRVPAGVDETDESDYHAEAGEDRVQALPGAPGESAGRFASP